MQIHPTATIAPSAVIEGDVRIGAHSHVSHGAILVGEGGTIEVGEYVTVMENAVLRGTARFPLTIADHCVIGPHASISGATIEPEVFVATGASVFPGATLGRGSEVRINGVVQLRTRLEPGATVPIGWVAVGDPAVILPAGDHEAIWAVQRELDFPGYVFGVDRTREDAMVRLTERLAASYERRAQ
jgi:carbonic anhydrase/acetyltransferase-like protein (isoleucine patch superfamily)